MSRSGDDARQRARGIRDEALSRLSERGQDSLGQLRREVAELKAMLDAQADQLAILTSMVARLESSRPSSALPEVSSPRPLTSHKRMILERIRELRAEDLSFSRICEIFLQEGVPTLSGDGQWSKGTLWNLWKNHRRQLDDLQAD